MEASAFEHESGAGLKGRGFSRAGLRIEMWALAPRELPLADHFTPPHSLDL